MPDPVEVPPVASRRLEQGQAHWTEATSQAKACLVNTDEAPARMANARPCHVQPGTR
jgi:hypothetical protein